MLFEYITLDTLECKEIILEIILCKIIFYLNMKVSVKKNVLHNFLKSPVSFKSKLSYLLYFF
jgi:hypothetical protein